MRTSILWCVVAAGLGFAAAKLTGARSVAPVPAPPVARATYVAAPAIPAESIRSAVRDALREERHEACAPAPAPPPPPPPPEPDPAALDSGRALVSAALAARRWGPDETADLRALLPQLSDAQRAELLRTLLPAVNRGEIEVNGSIF
jgi:hypothetical protein